MSRVMEPMQYLPCPEYAKVLRKADRKKKAQRAHDCLSFYSSGVVREDAGNDQVEVTDDLYDDAQTVVRDFLADIMHLCKRDRIDFNGALSDAMRQFSTERG